MDWWVIQAVVAVLAIGVAGHLVRGQVADDIGRGGVGMRRKLLDDR